jgi:cytochrome c oxidase subunit III
MNTVAMQQKNKIHPHKFTLWLALGSIVMMFAGLTSAYIVKRNQADWVGFEIPKLFWYSTVTIVLSSVLLYLAGKAFKEREMAKYRKLVTATLVLGVLFIVLQVIGFKQLWASGNTLQSTVSYSFLYVIVGIHAAHVVGGIIALLLLFKNAFNTKLKSYNNTSVDLISTYWHFVDGLWIYLLIFLIMIK